VTTTRSNNAESGLATGTAATTGNTGSPAGDAFTTVSAGTGGSITFDSAVTLHGSLNYLLTQGSAACFLEWNQTVLPALAQSYHRRVIRFTTLPSGEVPLFQGIGADLATQGWRISLLSSGKLRVRGTGSPGTSLADSTTVLATSTVYRISWHVVYGTSGSIEVRIYSNLESTVPTETIGPITTNTGTDLSRSRMGNTGSSPTLASLRLDDIVDTDTGWPGPVVVYAAPTAGYSYTVTGLEADFADTSTPAGGGPTLTSWAWDFGDGGTSTSQNPYHIYAAAGTYTVTLTVTDSLGRTGTTSHTVTLIPPASSVKWLSLDQSSGWTVQGGAGSVLAATTDGNPATFVVSLVAPTDQALGGAEGPMVALTPGLPLNLVVPCDKINASTGTVYGKLYQGATLISTSAAVAVPDADLSGGSPVGSLNKSVTCVFPWADVQNITDVTALKAYAYFNGS